MYESCVVVLCADRFIVVRVEDPNTKLNKFVLIGWVSRKFKICD